MEVILLDMAMYAGITDHQTTRQFTFCVPEGIKSILIELKYEPQSLQDAEKSRQAIIQALHTAGEEPADDRINACLPLHHLITLSLDDPLGYRGCAHRRANPLLLRLDDAGASPGFHARPLAAGDWRLSLHFHSLLQDKVNVRCLVRGEKP